MTLPHAGTIVRVAATSSCLVCLNELLVRYLRANAPGGPIEQRQRDADYGDVIWAELPALLAA